MATWAAAVDAALKICRTSSKPACIWGENKPTYDKY